MLTRIEVDGFKNLVDFSLDFGPYTCIAGENGVGKSNIFDAVRFLSLLTDHTIIQSALQIRSSEEGTGEIGELFFSANGETKDRITLAAEMIVGKRVVDDFGRPGVHPEKLTAMNQLLHDIAVDPDEPVAADNPLRQVIVATHSPYFVQLQNADDVVLAKNPALRALAGKVIRPLRCYPLQHTWRDRKNQEEQAGRARGVGKIELQAYLIPPEDGQISFPDRVPTPEVKVIEKDRATPRPRGKNWRAYFDKDTRGSLPARQEPPLEEQDQLRGSASLTSERMAGSRWRGREKHV